MPGNLITAKDQILWTQRINKELAINGKARNDFSVRSCVTSEEVPMKFKPGHVNPLKDKVPGGVFDPCSLGWKPDATITKEFQRCMKNQAGIPRERHQFPESRYQELGWAQSAPGKPEERSAPAGSNPTKLGIGWCNKDGHGGPITKKAAIDADKPEFQAYILQLMEKEKIPKPRSSKDGNRREELGIPPYASDTGGTVCPPEQHKGSRSQAGGRSSRSRKSEARKGSSAAAAAAAAAVPPRSTSLPSLGKQQPQLGVGMADADARLGSQEEEVRQAMENARLYLNRHRRNQWYHPLSQSDVANFANAYTICWGRCLFHKDK
jgi:hypothetical protein